MPKKEEAKPKEETKKETPKKEEPKEVAPAEKEVAKPRKLRNLKKRRNQIKRFTHCTRWNKIRSADYAQHVNAVGRDILWLTMVTDTPAAIVGLQNIKEQRTDTFKSFDAVMFSDGSDDQSKCCHN